MELDGLSSMSRFTTSLAPTMTTTYICLKLLWFKLPASLATKTTNLFTVKKVSSREFDKQLMQEATLNIVRIQSMPTPIVQH